jgi:hypothetical protein
MTTPTADDSAFYVARLLGQDALAALLGKPADQAAARALLEPVTSELSRLVPEQQARVRRRLDGLLPEALTILAGWNDTIQDEMETLAARAEAQTARAQTISWGADVLMASLGIGAALSLYLLASKLSGEAHRTPAGVDWRIALQESPPVKPEELVREAVGFARAAAGRNADEPPDTDDKPPAAPLHSRETQAEPKAGEAARGTAPSAKLERSLATPPQRSNLLDSLAGKEFLTLEQANELKQLLRNNLFKTELMKIRFWQQHPRGGWKNWPKQKGMQRVGFGAGLLATDREDAARYRLGLRLQLPFPVMPRFLAEISADLKKSVFGEWLSFRLTGPVQALSPSSRGAAGGWRGPSQALRIGSSIQAHPGGRIGAVGLLLEGDPGAYFAVTAGHVFTDRQGRLMPNAQAVSPAAIPGGTSVPVGLVAQASVFPDVSGAMGPGEPDYALVRLADVGSIPGPGERRWMGRPQAVQAAQAFHRAPLRQGQRLFKAAARSAASLGMIETVETEIDVHDEVSGAILDGRGLVEMRLDRTNAGTLIMPGDSGTLSCVVDESFTPLGIVVAGSAQALLEGHLRSAASVAYILPFSAMPGITAMKVL